MEQKIIRTQVVVVADRDINQYGDTIFHDGEGKEYKLGNKRADMSDQIVEGRAVSLGWANFKDRDYIATAKLVEGELPDEVKPTAHAYKAPESAAPKTQPARYDPSGQERGMWWKQLGDDLRSGHVDRTSSLGKALRKCYFAEMFKVLDITMEEEVK